MEISSFELGFGGAEEQKKMDLKENGDECLARFGLKWVCFDAARRAIFAQLAKSLIEIGSERERGRIRF